MGSFLKKIFDRLIQNKQPSHDTYDIRKVLDETLPIAKDRVSYDDYVLVTDFYHDTLLPALKKHAGIRGYNLVSGVYSGMISREISQGKTPVFTPKQLKKDHSGQDILFAYDCYVPARFLLKKTVGALKVAAFMGNMTGAEDQKGLTRAYIEASRNITEITRPKDSIDRDRYTLHSPQDGPLPFYQSAVESGGFDFVLRPKENPDKPQNQGPRSQPPGPC